MMMADDRHNRREAFQVPADLDTARGVRAHHFPLFGRQLALLKKDGVRDADLSNIVHVPAAVED